MQLIFFFVTFSKAIKILQFDSQYIATSCLNTMNTSLIEHLDVSPEANELLKNGKEIKLGN